MKQVGINQRVTPIKLCFLIMPDSESSFMQAAEIACGLWGGLFCPILPFYETLPGDFRNEYGIEIPTGQFYWNSLENYDVDAVVIDDDIDRAVVTKIVTSRIILTVTELITGKGHLHHYNYGIPIHLIAEDVAENNFKFLRQDKAQFTLPKIADNQLFLKAWVGTLTQAMSETIEEIFSFYNSVTSVQVDWGTVDSYLQSDYPNPLTLSNYKLSLWPNQLNHKRILLYCLDATRLRDIISFWNLRAAGNFVTPIPYNRPMDESLQAIFNVFYQRQLDNQDGGFNIITCLDNHSSSQIVFDLQANYHSTYPKTKGTQIAVQSWFPRFWEEHELQVSDHVKAATPFSQSEFSYYDAAEQFVKFPALPLPFRVGIDLSKRWTYRLQIELTMTDPFGEYAGLISGISERQLRGLLGDMAFGEGWRVSAGILHRIILANRSSREIHLNPPKAMDFFSMLFHNKDYDLHVTSNSKLAQEVFRNMHGLYGFMFYRQKGRLSVIEMFENGNEVGFAALLGAIKRNMNNTDSSGFFISRLLEHKIIEFGALIKCSVCEQSGYFLSEDILNQLRCPMCRNSFALPMSTPNKIQWAYRGIGPFTRNNKAGGVMSVFATLWLFLEHITDDKKISSLFGFELRKRDQTIHTNPMEIDLCLLAGDKHDQYKEPDLIFCECKTYIELKQVDIDRMQMLGDQFPDAILVFATLNEALSANEVSLLIPLVQHFQKGHRQRPRNPVLIFTGQELLSEDSQFPLKSYEDKMHTYSKRNDYLGTLSALTIRKHLKIRTWAEIQSDLLNLQIARTRMIGNIVDAVLKSKQNTQ